MNEYEPKFFTTERNGKTALWVVMPDGTEQNLWDVSFLTHDLESMIPLIFKLGMKAVHDQIKRIDTPTLFSKSPFEKR